MKLMKKFNTFYFKSFEFDRGALEAKFYYSFDNEVFFEEVLYFWDEKFDLRDDIDVEVVENIMFHIHIALWVSYYKAFPTKDLVVESGILDENQIEFWKKFYINWLGEFLYTNNISPKWLFNFVVKSDKKYSKKDFNIENKSLVALWWWKDSIVSMELLEKAWFDYELVVFWKLDDLKLNVANKANKKILLIKRKLSDTLFELNKKWYYNWHIPITWVIAFILELSSYLYNYKYTILSNELSANSENTSWEWIKINHQYSKSLEFEIDFKKYVEKYITSEIKYFSLLRWMYETKIAEKFAKLWKKYFDVFSSCNNNFKLLSNSTTTKNKKIWCNKCPKCVFVFTVLRQYLNKEEVLQIFWEDLFVRKDLEKLFKELLWVTWIKPFECVWEHDEMLYSMYKSLEKYDKKNKPYIMNLFEKEILSKNDKNYVKKLEKKLDRIYEDDIIPIEIKTIVFK